jgi:hypothetical protein
MRHDLWPLVAVPHDSFLGIRKLGNAEEVIHGFERKSLGLSF